VVSLTRRPCAPSDGPTSANQNSNPNLTITTVPVNPPPSGETAPHRPRPLPPPLVAAGPAPGRGSRGGEFSYSIRKLDLSSSDSYDAPSGRIEPSRRRGGVPPGGSARALWPVGDVRHQDHRGRDVCMRALTLAIRGSAYVEVGDGGLVLLDPCRRRGPTTSRLYGSGSASQSRRSGAQVDSPRRVATTDRRARVLRRRLAGAVVSSMTGSATCELQCTAGFEPTELQRATKAKAARNLMIFLHWSSSPPPQMD
jgi:hypothetical protein